MSEAILSKVRKLLAKAEDPACPPAEAQACTAKATELIAKYGVDRARLAAQDPTSDAVVDRTVVVPPPYARDKAHLLGGVAGELRCRAVRLTRAEGFAMRLFGFASDLERAELLFTSLLVQAAHGLAATPIPEYEHPAAFRRSWLEGFTYGILERLRAAERQAADAPAAGPSTALVLADRSAEVDRRLAQAYPRIRFTPPRRLTGGGLQSGLAAGRRADLGGSSVSGPRPGRSLPRAAAPDRKSDCPVRR